jgi:alpha-glucuronidase
MKYIGMPVLKITVICLLFSGIVTAKIRDTEMTLKNEDGYNLWLRYNKIEQPQHLAQYRTAIESITVVGGSKSFDIVRNELALALPVMLDKKISFTDKPAGNGLVATTIDNLKKLNIDLQQDFSKLGDEGFTIQSISKDNKNLIIITANSDVAVVTGTFHFLRLLQTNQNIQNLNIISIPRIRYRIASHWDNLDGSIERGYAGQSLWKWDELPGKIDPRYYDYARASASVGINCVILNNVNDQTESLSSEYLKKTAVLADIFRPYGIKIFLTAVFSAPQQLGHLPTSDPRNPAVAKWWKQKADEIYAEIPDFGGFQVKASSEGSPGPQDNGANHDDGANMMADALRTHGGIVLWRAFVYDTAMDSDRFKCAYKEFVPLDGKFKDEVMIQVKNGPIDFQPREPVHPLFGAMTKTPLALEVQITQEYLGQANHLVYLAPMWKETLDWDTFAKGAGSTVAKVIDGSIYGSDKSAIIGVTNTGSDRNWCGHHFGQANWFAFGRLAWDYQLTSEEICEQWIRMTFSNDPAVVDALKEMMLGSWQACIDYMTPLGLHHIMKEHHHYGPQPGLNTASRADWNSVYYHRADANGLGFDRTSKGSNAVGQYRSPLREQFENIETCPEEFLLWFHHVDWNYRMKSGRTLWQELQYHYDAGVQYTEKMQKIWKTLEKKIDPQRFKEVEEKLKIQHNDALEWREVCLKYFGQFAERNKE